MATSAAPADELAEVRAQIATLRAREAALEAAFISMRDSCHFPGYANTVRVERKAHQVFDLSKLPQRVLDDPRLYITREVTRVIVEPRAAMTPLILKRTHEWTSRRGRTPEAIAPNTLHAAE